MAVTLHGVISLDWSSVQRAMRGTQLAVRSFVATTGRGLYDATGRLRTFSLYFAGAAGAAAAWAVKKAGDFEMLQLRLRVAMGDSAKAARAWRDTMMLAINMPMIELEPLIKARILLENFGMQGTEALKAVSAAAVMTGREVTDVAAALGSMETEPLRRMGITSRARMIRQPGGAPDIVKWRLGFRDRAQQKIEVKVTGIEQARAAVLQIFRIKYGGSELEQVNKTWKGLWTQFTDAATVGISQIATAIRNQLAPYLEKLNSWLIEGLQSGMFTKWGEALFSWIGNVLRFIHALVRAWNSLSKVTHEQLGWIMAASGAFIVAWKTGFVEAFAMGLAYLVTTNKFAFLAMTGTITAFATFLVGRKIGRVLEETFAISSLYLKWAFVLERMAYVFGYSLENLVYMAKTGGRMIADALTGNFIGVAMGKNLIAEALMGQVRELNPQKLAAEIKEKWRQVDEVSGNPGMGIDATRARFAEAVEREFKTWEGWLKDFAWLVPEPLKKAFEAMRLELQKLPQLKLSKDEIATGEELARNMGEAEKSAEKIKRMKEPLRVYDLGPGFRRGGAGIPRRGSQIPVDKGWPAGLRFYDPYVSDQGRERRGMEMVNRGIRAGNYTLPQWLAPWAGIGNAPEQSPFWTPGSSGHAGAARVGDTLGEGVYGKNALERAGKVMDAVLPTVNVGQGSGAPTAEGMRGAAEYYKKWGAAAGEWVQAALILGAQTVAAFASGSESRREFKSEQEARQQRREHYRGLNFRDIRGKIEADAAAGPLMRRQREADAARAKAKADKDLSAISDNTRDMVGLLRTIAGVKSPVSFG